MHAEELQKYISELELGRKGVGNRIGNSEDNS